MIYLFKLHAKFVLLQLRVHFKSFDLNALYTQRVCSPAVLAYRAVPL